MSTDVAEKTETTETIAEQDQVLFDGQQEATATLDEVYTEMEKSPTVSAEDAEKTVTGRPRDAKGRYLPKEAEATEEPTEEPEEKPTEEPKPEEVQGVEDSKAAVPDDEDEEPTEEPETPAEETPTEPSPANDIAEQDLVLARQWGMSDEEAKGKGTRAELYTHMDSLQRVAEATEQRMRQQFDQQQTQTHGGINEHLTEQQMGDNLTARAGLGPQFVASQQDVQTIGERPVDAALHVAPTQQPKQQPPDGQVQPFELNLPEDIDPGVADAFKQMNEHYSGLQQENATQLATLQQQHQEATAKVQAEAEQRQSEERGRWLDDNFSQLDKDHGGAFGDGDFNSQSPEKQAARAEVARTYFALSGANPNGDPAEILQSAVRASRFFVSPQKQAVAALNGKVKKRAAQKLGSPTARNVLDPADTWDGDPTEDPILHQRFASYEG